MGDGYFARTTSVAAAVRFALRFQEGMREAAWPGLRLATRVGIHAGEVADMITRGQSDVLAPAADLAARVMSLAVGGQILLTRWPFNEAQHFVREHPRQGAATDSKIDWRDHGPYFFKGWNDAVEIFEVGAAGQAPLTPPPDGEKAWSAPKSGGVKLVKKNDRRGCTVTILFVACIFFGICRSRLWHRSDESKKQTAAERPGAAENKPTPEDFENIAFPPGGVLPVSMEVIEDSRDIAAVQSADELLSEFDKGITLYPPHTESTRDTNLWESHRRRPRGFLRVAETESRPLDFEEIKDWREKMRTAEIAWRELVLLTTSEPAKEELYLPFPASFIIQAGRRMENLLK
jgi:hypothetical protein